MFVSFKKLILLLLLGVLTLPAYALSLGSIKINSGLNQPLHADIPIYDVDPASLVDARVELASHEVHNQYGLEKSNALRKLRFKIIRNEQGQFVIRLTTQRAIREPVLEFVLNVSNKKGNLRRSYAVHLDPPKF